MELPPSFTCPPLGAADAFPWYAVWVKSNCEKGTAAALQGKGYEAFLPLYRVQNPWGNRSEPVDLPLFPGYVFCRLDVQRRLPVLTVPGVVSIIGFGKTPAPVPEQEILAIQTIARSDKPAAPWPYLREGQRVRVVRGALKGLEGFLLNVKNGVRVVVSVGLLQRSVAAEVDRAHISPVV